MCGKLIKIDQRSLNREIITAVRLKVEVESIAVIPRILSFKKEGGLMQLVIEVESPVMISQEMNTDGKGGFFQHHQYPRLEIRDEGAPAVGSKPKLLGGIFS